MAGAALLFAAELSTLVRLEVGGVVRERLSGHAQHDWALALLAVAAVLLAAAWARRPSPGPALGLLALGVVAALIALVGDLPDVRATGVLAGQYEAAEAAPGAAFWLELAGAALVLCAGALGLARVRARVTATRRARAERRRPAPRAPR